MLDMASITIPTKKRVCKKTSSDEIDESKFGYNDEKQTIFLQRLY